MGRAAHSQADQVDSPTPKSITLVHSFPAVLQGEVAFLSHTFQLHNPTDQARTITNIRKPCSCVEVRLESRQIAARSTIDAMLKVSTRGRDGPFSLDVVFETATAASYQFKLDVPLYRRHEFTPDFIRDGNAQPGVQIERQFRVISYGRDPATLAPVVSCRSSTAETTAILSDGVVQQIASDLWCQTTNGTVRVKVPNESGYGFAELAVADAPSTFHIEWVVPTAYEMSPHRIFCRLAKQQTETPTYRVGIHRVDGRPFAIVEAKPTKPFALCQTELPTKRALSHDLTVSLDPGAIQVFDYCALVLTTDDPINQAISLPIAVAK